jgi:uncharacterized protein with PQ loop repeat
VPDLPGLYTAYVLPHAEVAIDVLVGLSAFVMWALFLPQMRLLMKLKDSRSVSLASAWGSCLAQMLILTQGVFKGNWTLVASLGVSTIFFLATIFLIHYYRWFPGGRTRRQPSGQRT